MSLRFDQMVEAALTQIDHQWPNLHQNNRRAIAEETVRAALGVPTEAPEERAEELDRTEVPRTSAARRDGIVYGYRDVARLLRGEEEPTT